MTVDSVAASKVLDRVLVLEMVRVTEAAAIAAAKLIGRGDEKAADAAAVEAMRAALNELDFDGTVVIGEGERDEAPMLYIGEKVGRRGTGPKIDIALDPLEGTTITAKAGPNALAVLAIAEEGCLLNAPDVYMDKIAVGPGYARRDHRPRPDADRECHARSPRPRASSRTRSSSCVLDRPRHEKLIAELRALGCGDHADRRRRRRRRDRDHQPRHHDRHLYGLGRRARGRAGGGGAALRRRPVQGPAAVPQRRREGAGPQMGRHRSQPRSTSSTIWSRATASSPRPA